MKHLFRSLMLVALVAVTLVGCAERNTTEYKTRGRVVALTPEINTVTILHEEIPGYLPSEETSFMPAEADDLQGLMVGDLVSFDIEVAEDGSSVIDDIEKLPAGTALVLVEPAPPVPVMPDSLMMADSTLVADSLVVADTTTL